MADTLTVSPKLSPFPYAAAAIALYTDKADLVFDDAATGPVLVLNGSKFSEEDEIVHVLSEAGGLSADSAKVS